MDSDKELVKKTAAYQEVAALQVHEDNDNHDACDRLAFSSVPG